MQAVPDRQQWLAGRIQTKELRYVLVVLRAAAKPQALVQRHGSPHEVRGVQADRLLLQLSHAGESCLRELSPETTATRVRRDTDGAEPRPVGWPTPALVRGRGVDGDRAGNTAVKLCDQKFGAGEAAVDIEDVSDVRGKDRGGKRIGELSVGRAQHLNDRFMVGWIGCSDGGHGTGQQWHDDDLR